MKKSTIAITIINIFVLLTALFSYYLEKRIGYILYNLVAILFIGLFILYSLLIICVANRKKICCLEQFLTVLFLCLTLKFDLQDRFALIIELPKIEKRLELIKNTEDKCDEYILFDWAPGFLDYKMVLVYDDKDSLKNIENDKIKIVEGTLYILFRAKKCFYICVLYY